VENSLAYGVCVGSESRFQAVAESSILAQSPEAIIITRRDARSICGAYNSILDEAHERGLPGLLLVHEDVEIRDADVERKLFEIFLDTEVAIIGVIGGRGVRDMAWWYSEELVGCAPDSFAPTRDTGVKTGDVDMVDGIFLALSAWAIAHLRFDARRFRGFHGYDADICCQARSAGRRVVVGDIEIFHHTLHSSGSATHAWHEALYRWRGKWLPASAGTRAAWRLKAAGHGLVGRIKP
jgi:hypothetical protein